MANVGQPLEGRVAVVTGACMGIGRATALSLATRGAAIAAWDIRGDLLESPKAEVEALGRGYLGLTMDVTIEAQVQQAVEQTERSFGRIDILVNAAGGSMGVASGVDKLTSDDWDKVVELNLRGSFLTCMAVLPMMRRQRSGSVINVSSGAGRSIGLGAVLPYSAAKAGVLGLTRQLAVFVAKEGVRVNAVAPGTIKTERVMPHWDAMPEEERQRRLARIPMGRQGSRRR